MSVWESLLRSHVLDRSAATLAIRATMRSSDSVVEVPMFQLSFTSTFRRRAPDDRRPTATTWPIHTIMPEPTAAADRETSSRSGCWHAATAPSRRRTCRCDLLTEHPAVTPGVCRPVQSRLRPGHLGPRRLASKPGASSRSSTAANLIFSLQRRHGFILQKVTGAGGGFGSPITRPRAVDVVLGGGVASRNATSRGRGSRRRP